MLGPCCPLERQCSVLVGIVYFAKNLSEFHLEFPGIESKMVSSLKKKKKKKKKK